jgi:SAP domain-containing new25
MKLAELLAELPADQVRQIAHEHIRPDQELSHHALCATLETAIRSFSFIQNFILNRQPPAFVLLTLALDSDVPLNVDALRDFVDNETKTLVELVRSGEVVGRNEGLRIYRRVFWEARRSELTINESEAALLNVLRRELALTLAEHFLLEHHPDFHEFWLRENSFDYELFAFQSAGVLFRRGDDVLIPDDLRIFLQQAIGLEAPLSGCKRLLARLSSSDIARALEESGLKTAGSKEDRIQRFLQNRVSPSRLLRGIGLDSLKEVCRELDIVTSGNKDELVERIVEHFGRGFDVAAQVQEELAPPTEAKMLEERRFRALFQSLRGVELGKILEAFPKLKQSGSKEQRVSTLWGSPFAEATLLNTLAGRAIEDALFDHRLKIGGSKGERIGRLLSHYIEMSDEELDRFFAARDPSPSAPEPSEATQPVAAPSTVPTGSSTGTPDSNA